MDSHIAWLAVWNRHISRAAEGTEGTNVGAHSDVNDDNDGAYDRDNERNILYAEPFAQQADVPAEGASTREARSKLSQRVGLAQGLVDFTHSFARSSKAGDEHDDDSEGEAEVDPSKQIQVVNSGNQRLIFLQAEKNYWITAAFDRYSANRNHAHSRDSSHASDLTSVVATRKNVAQVGKRQPYSTASLSDEAFLELIRRTYLNFKLQNGSFELLYQEVGYFGLRSRLQAFFNHWRKDSMRSALRPLGAPCSPCHLPIGYALEDTDGESQSVMVCSSGILQVPEDLRAGQTIIASSGDYLSLAIHLMEEISAACLCETSTANASAAHLAHNSALSADGGSKTIKKQNSMSSASWKTLGLGGLSNFLPSVPLPTLPIPYSGTTPRDETAVREQGLLADTPRDLIEPNAKRSVSGPTWLPSLRMFSTSSPEKANREQKSVPAVHREGVKQEGSADSSITTKHATTDDLETTQSDGDLHDRAALPDARAIEEALGDDLSSEMPSATLSEHLGRTEDNLERQPGSLCKVRTKHIFVGVPGQWQEMAYILDEDLAVASIIPAENHPSPIDRQAVFEQLTTLHQLQKSRLSEQRVSEATGSPSLYYSFSPRQLCSTYVSRIDDRASSTAATPTQRINLISRSKRDAKRVKESLLCESHELFIRNHASQWIVEKKPNHLHVLPRSVGKEGSLLEVDYELRSI